MGNIIKTYLMKWLPVAPYRLLFGMYLILFFAACTTITTHTPDGKQVTRSVNEFEAYAEDVFRRQNKASAEIIILLYANEMDIDHINYEPLIDAEIKIEDACQLLADYALMESEKREPDLLFRHFLVSAIVECDYATRDVEALLNNYE